MAVRRIVANIETQQIARASNFYGDVLGMSVAMDHGWIVTFVAPGECAPQVSFASEGGSGAPVPDLSIEVDDLDETHARALRAGFSIEYGPVSEPWGVRRFFVRDPAGTLVNIVMHTR